MNKVKDWRPLKLDELSGDEQKVFDVLNKETDLACVLIGTSYLSEVLSTMLKEHFVETSVAEKMLDPQRGSLGGFAVRADLAYCLGLIQKETYQDLIKMAEIRNMFAHKHLALTFADSTIKSNCQALKAWQIVAGDDYVEPPGGQSQEELRMQARNQFNLSVVLCGNLMLVAALGRERNKEKSRLA